MKALLIHLINVIVIMSKKYFVDDFPCLTFHFLNLHQMLF